MGQEVTITYETIFELLRREKNRVDVQELEADFYREVVSYLEDKHRLMEAADSPDDRAQIRNQIDNIRRLLRDLYQKREQKIMNLALMSVKSDSDTPPSSLLKGEQDLFKDLCGVLRNHKKNVIDKVLNMEKQENAPTETLTMVMFTHAVPKFMGKHMKVYGPFGSGDVANLPSELTAVLIKKGHARKMEPA